jgi:hypothetical protein
VRGHRPPSLNVVLSTLEVPKPVQISEFMSKALPQATEACPRPTSTALAAAGAVGPRLAGPVGTMTGMPGGGGGVGSLGRLRGRLGPVGVTA